ncbi:MAG: M42 family metallopeptidase [Armatimonadetes bacterium]|nr:M42 family metallopeptidase [Armatimonadota bacterium]
MPRFDISTEYLVRFLQDLVNTPSPTGDTDWAISFVEAELESLGIHSVRTTKGALIAYDDGLRNDKPRALTAHVDTLGAMVSEIKDNGRLKLTALNGVMWPSVESEGVTVSTRRGTQVRGSIVFANGSVHVNKEAKTKERNAETLEVRLDERTATADETRLLGIDVGDFVAFDPRFENGPAGFVRSRFLDDKACVACVVAAFKALKDAGVSPAQRTHVLFSNYEEVGHGGMDGIPDDVVDLLVVDMACVGDGQNGDEFHCSICLKDSGGPYSRDLTERIRGLADRNGIELRPDVYPHYGSDGTAYWQAGGRAQVGLIGPGVDTSHGYERTHVDALRDTAALIAEFLIED